ncbi:MAG: tetratricopeptide repeat protein, partial [Actinobacteria bacterium]|nr:tetratricopeptide repeat protein [Actinomycetota bacterium]
MSSGRDSRLGETLRRLRQAAGMTQEELAERAGISARAVSDTERGLRSAVHADTARRVAAALRLDGGAREQFESLARGRPSGEHLAPPASTLPEVPTPLLGRSGELQAITEALTGRGMRLLTLTGPGGIGKTRLAAEAARRVEASFSGGIHFVSLGEVSDAALVVPEVAKTIGAPETGGDLQALLAKRLAGRPALIVLDTFEHLTAAAPQVYAAMLGCPAVTFLVTSRSALRLRGEQQYPVPPLELPYGTEEVSPERLARWPATALFWERALAVRPDLPLDAPAATLVAEICRKLNGLPLAIELAAARVRHLPLAAVRDQLTDRLRLLVGGTLDLPRRQRTIRDTMAWSHDLLAPAQAELFRRLAVFSGGWDLASAGAVCSTGETGDVLEGISALVDQSLVVVDHAHPQGRYHMLDVIREYAAARLAESGEADEVSLLHARCFLALAEEAEPNLARTGHQDWFRRLDAERGNFRRAMAWAIECGNTVLALRYTAALWRYWRQLGEFTEGRRWTDSALSLAGDAPVPLRARALRAAAALAFPQGDYQRLAALASEAMELARRSEDPMDMRNALTIAGFVAVGRGRYQDALDAFGGCVAICQRLGPSWQLATSHLNLGAALLHVGRPRDADSAFAAGLRIYRQLGDDLFAARTINQRAQAALALGGIDQADGLARDALAGFASHEERQGIAEGLETLAVVAAARSDPGRAAILAGAAAAIRETIAASQLPDLIITTR